MLDDRHLLKKGSVVHLVTEAFQLDTEIWGADAARFNPERFLAKVSKENKKVQSQAFIPFGGGKNMCPGRHLALTEITSFVAMLGMCMLHSRRR